MERYHFFERYFWSPLQTYVRVAYDGQPTLMRDQIRKFRSDYTPAGVDYNIEAKFQLSFKTASGGMVIYGGLYSKVPLANL
jgi:hypothetical protein